MAKKSGAKSDKGSYHGIQDLLTCPNCGGTHVTIQQVTVFSRDKEDSPSGLRVAVDMVGTLDMDRMPNQGNPSARRNGVLLHVGCEDCRGGLLGFGEDRGQVTISGYELA